MGLIVNRLMGGMKLSDVIDTLSSDQFSAADQKFPVHFGGPVEGSRGFVLHTSDYSSKDSTLMVDDEFGLTSSMDVIEAILQGAGPELALLALGYSGWGPGQLEAELAENAWLVGEPNRDQLFIDQDHEKWANALRVIGVEPLSLSSEAGHA